MTTLRLIKSIGRSSSRLALLLIPLVFACFALSPMAQAVSPPPDGGYPGQNTAEGQNALFNLSPTDGGFNTAIGWVSLFSNTTGSLNTGVGAGTLWANTSHNNTAVGAGALALNTTGDGNTANGALSLLQNTEGRGNTALGAATLFFNTEGSGNTAVGAQALLNNTGPPGLFGNSSLNTAVGVNALTENTTGGGNTAVGAGPGVVPQPSPSPPLVIPSALGSNTTGRGNTAVGASDLDDPAALGSNTTGSYNTAVGSSALGRNTTGEHNIAVGVGAGIEVTAGNNNIDIGNYGGAGESATIRIGQENYPDPSPVPTRTFIAGIRLTTTGIADAVNVVIDSMGQLGTMSSSVRFKKEIKTMDKASEAILALKPVTFHYKSDNTNTPQFGLIAEEVAKVNPNLVVRDKDGQIYTVRYDAVNAMLLNEFLKEHRKVEELNSTVATKLATISDLKSTVAQQQKGMEVLTARLNEQAAQIQKVSAQLETSKPAPQVVNNP